MSERRFSRSDVARYYDRTGFDYAVVWQSPLTGSLHYGFWQPKVRTLAGALKEQTRTVARAGRVREGSQVLDAGCGIGGPALLMAEEYGAHVTGITVSASQVETARRRAGRAGLAGRVRFEEADYTATPYPDGTFDVVVAVESVCHAEQKADFLAEAFRLLKPGGRLAVADGFRTDRDLSEQEERLMRVWLDGWRVDDLDTVPEFVASAEQVGFEDVVARDMTEQALPSSRRLYASAVALDVFHQSGRKLGLRGEDHAGNIAAARAQYPALRRGL